VAEKAAGLPRWIRANSEYYYNFISPEKIRVRIKALFLPQNSTYNPVNRRIQPVPIFIGRTRMPIAIGIGVRGAPPLCGTGSGLIAHGRLLDCQ